jgi:hypothetical protein
MGSCNSFKLGQQANPNLMDNGVNLQYFLYDDQKLYETP